MVAIVKPDFENIWASEGGVRSPTLDQILSGWRQNQFPPSEIANFLQKRVDSAIAYILQNGLPEWDSKIEYQKSSIVKYEGKHFISKTVNINKIPRADSTDWTIAFDAYGASNDLRAEISKIMGVNGYIPFYVKKSDPVMTATAKAPSFEADVGATGGFKFKGYQSGVYSLGGDIYFTSGGVVNGRIKNTPPTLEMNDDTLVTTALLNKVIEQIKKDTQIPVGWSVVTNNSKPPSDKDQLGYGTWVLDVQGRALVGVSKGTAENIPEWVRDPNSEFGDYNKVINENNLPSFKAPLLFNTWVHGDDAAGSGAVLTANRNFENGVQYPKNAFAEYKGENVPMNVVQPSQTKYIWTRTA